MSLPYFKIYSAPYCLQNHIPNLVQHTCLSLVLIHIIFHILQLLPGMRSLPLSTWYTFIVFQNKPSEFHSQIIIVHSSMTLQYLMYTSVIVFSMHCCLLLTFSPGISSSQKGIFFIVTFVASSYLNDWHIINTQ